MVLLGMLKDTEIKKNIVPEFLFLTLFYLGLKRKINDLCEIIAGMLGKFAEYEIQTVKITMIDSRFKMTLSVGVLDGGKPPKIKLSRAPAV